MKCGQCEKDKPKTDFYKGRRKCKECIKAKVKKNVIKNKLNNLYIDNIYNICYYN